MLDIKKAIPAVEFPTRRLIVGNPSLEPMVYLDDEFYCDSMYNHWVGDNGNPVPGSSPSIMARATVCRMLHEAEALLPEGYRFKIYDAYRPIAVQQALYDHFRAEKRAEHPEMTEDEIDAATLLCVSFPSYNVLLPSLHNSGGAVDLTIIDANGEEIDMGCGFDEFTDRAWTNYYEPDSGFGAENEIARDNRRMLYNIMISVGFTNFPSEWWHFDYGDEKWGQFTKSVPIYAGSLDAGLRDAVPYENEDLVKRTNEKEQEIVRKIAALRAECDELDAEAAEVIRGY